MGGAQNAGSAKRSGPGGAPVAAGKGGAASCGSAGQWLGEELPPGAERGTSVRKFGSTRADRRLLKRQLMSRPRGPAASAPGPLHTRAPHLTCCGRTSGAPSVSLRPQRDR